MAGFQNSLLLAAQAALDKRMEAPEFRTKPYNLIKMLLDRGKNLLTPQTYEAYKISDQRVVYGYVFANRSVTVGSARSGTHTLAALGETQQVTIGNTIISGTYGTTLKTGDRNLFTMGETLSHDLMSASIAINDALETAIAAWLSSYKTQANLADSTAYARFGEWDSSNYVWQVPADAEKWLFQYVQRVMAVNKYAGALDLICDPVAYAIMQQYQTQGSGNETNTGWQFGNVNIVESLDIADTNYAATIYAVPRGTIGLVNRVPAVNKSGFSGKEVTYSSMSDPLGTGLEEAVHYYESAYDGSSAGSETQDLKFEYENSTDYGLVKAPLSAGATYSTIHKIVLMP